MNERRSDPRLEVSLAATWEGVPSNRMTRVTDLSAGGCYIDTIAEVSVGDLLEFKMLLPSGKWLELKGEVVNQLRGLGFGLHFVELTGEQLRKLQQLIRYFSDLQAAQRTKVQPGKSDL